MGSGPLSFQVDAGGAFRRAPSVEALTRALREENGTLWVDIDSRRDAEWRLLSELFGFHPLAIEDTRSPGCRVKLEEYEGYLFIVVRAVRLAEATPEPYDIETINLYLFLGPNYLVTVHGEPSRSVETVAARLEAAPEFLERGPDHAAYLVIDALVDFYFPLLDEIDRFIEDCEDGIFGRGGKRDSERRVMERILDLRRTLLALRRHLAAMREVTASLANRPTRYIDPAVQTYFRDVYDHVVRQVESVEVERELLSNTLDANLLVASNRLNQVIKSLTIVATLVLPPTLLAGIYGMNFDRIPGAESPLGFWVAVAAMGAVSGTFLIYLWRKGWL